LRLIEIINKRLFRVLEEEPTFEIAYSWRAACYAFLERFEAATEDVNYAISPAGCYVMALANSHFMRIPSAIEWCKVSFPSISLSLSLAQPDESFF
jgi:hypothetical protein